MLAGAHPAFDSPVILFQDIVKVLHGSMSTVLLQGALGFELYDGWRVSGVLVGVDNPRVRMVCTSQALAKKRLAATVSRLAERRKSIVAPVVRKSVYVWDNQSEQARR